MKARKIPKATEPLITLERGGKDRLVPKDFREIMTRRFFPVLSLTYIASVVGIAAQRGDVLHRMVYDQSVYLIAALVALWVSIPAVLWILLQGSHLYNHVADDWYKISASLMIITLCLSYILFPEANVWGLRLYFAATIPVLVILYLFFVKGGLPPVAAHPLTALGLTFLLYGAAVNIQWAVHKIALMQLL